MHGTTYLDQNHHDGFETFAKAFQRSLIQTDDDIGR
jgi:hypothetical protein